jgi:hypothetical protein
MLAEWWEGLQLALEVSLVCLPAFIVISFFRRVIA